MPRRGISPAPKFARTANNPRGYDMLKAIIWLQGFLSAKGYFVRTFILKGMDKYVWAARVKRSKKIIMELEVRSSRHSFRFGVDIEDDLRPKDEVIARFYFLKPKA